ncbi:ABC transporter ATP-binding protein [Pediococcus acidilactici]|uniref:ABC transporter ATP-binding protein n=1 Tax=Pediococcus acidilactici TaxID=1254 RepID=UPI0007B696CA|nr:ABC transporter ATP-binding protein [Pediococcus acidilactici]KZX38595.1 ABC transporter [Pediococcus acidilactici]OAC45714.1 ABC transporter [Pediococcus acidilactici]QHS02397.1 ABC transporter ATP-binding protein [Pediococcus acidilactici]
MEKVTINNLTFKYRQATQPILKQLNFHLTAGSFNVLYGPSGGGKSTLLRIIAGLYPHFAGTIIQGTVKLEEKDVTAWQPAELTQKLALLFQNPREQFAMDQVEKEFIFTLENLAIPADEIDDLITQALSQVGIAHLRHRQLATLSGGELQKVALAITLATGSDLILLDEPFANVDLKSRKALIKLLKKLQAQEGKTILIADHDLNDYAEICDHLYQLDHQQVSLITDPQPIFARYQLTTRTAFPIPNANAAAILKLQDFGIENGGRYLLQAVQTSFPKQHLILLTGENGSGKSTLFEAIARLHPYQGKLFYDNRPLSQFNARTWAKTATVVFQDSEMQFLKMTVTEEIDLSLQHAREPQYWTADRIQDWLERLNLAGLQDQIVYQLSGGQKKKLQILTMLILGNPLVLLDEPLAGLDLASVRVVMQLIQKAAQVQKQTIVMISHQLTGLPEFFDYHLALTDHQLIYQEELNGFIS